MDSGVYGFIIGLVIMAIIAPFALRGATQKFNRSQEYLRRRRGGTQAKSDQEK